MALNLGTALVALAQVWYINDTHNELTSAKKKQQIGPCRELVPMMVWFSCKCNKGHHLTNCPHSKLTNAAKRREFINTNRFSPKLDFCELLIISQPLLSNVNCESFPFNSVVLYWFLKKSSEYQEMENYIQSTFLATQLPKYFTMSLRIFSCHPKIFC